MWVLCCGMLRSGSTLHYNIARELVEATGSGIAVGSASDRPYTETLDRYAATAAQQHVVLKIHTYKPELQPLIDRGDVKALYIYRDVRDVVVSWINMQQIEFDDLPPNFVQKRCLDRFATWTGLSDVLVSRYEDVMAQPLEQEVTRIAAYLGLDASPEIVGRVAASCSMESQRAHIGQFEYATRGKASSRTRYDPQSLLHDRHILSGAAGQWQTALTAQQVATVEAVSYRWLVDQGYTLSARTRFLLLLQDGADSNTLSTAFDDLLGEQDRREATLRADIAALQQEKDHQPQRSTPRWLQALRRWSR